MKELAAWYQKKISSYDKAEWETLIEQLLARGSSRRRRVVDFSTHISARSYLIDVDLVRGSSFPKAKPTLGVWRVVWFALIRLIFLPGLFRWWRQQTSPTCARVLLALWLLQVGNLTLYFLAPANYDIDVDSLLVPLGLMVALSVVHAQIVSTTALELGRVRPRAAGRRKLPRYFRQARLGCNGDSPGSAESGATSTHSMSQGSKPAKFRRRASLARSKEEKKDDGVRKRKKTLEKGVMSKGTDAPVKTKTFTKAKNSDDEDYMDWKRPPVSAPTVTFTPPPEDQKVPTDNPFHFKPNVLTKKRLESLNGREDQRNQNVTRISFADGDDGFESLNGNYSNGSDNETRKPFNRPNDANTDLLKPSRSAEKNIDTSAGVANEILSEGSNKSEKIFMKIDEKIEAVGEIETEQSWSPEVGESPGKKSAGVRFRNSWVQEMIEKKSSDSDVKPKEKKSSKYQTTSSEGECECETASAPSIGLPSQHTMSDWVGQTSNTEDYSTESDGSQSDAACHWTDTTWDPFSILNPATETVKCMMWEKGEALKAELSAVDISWFVVARAERAMASDGGYLWAGVAMAAAVALISPAARLLQVASDEDAKLPEEAQGLYLNLPWLLFHHSKGSALTLLTIAFGDNLWVCSMSIISCFLRFALSGLCFFLLAVAERAFKQRFLYAKLFSHLTSARRARKSELPHFRLNTVRNIKTWLSARSYLRRRGPQRSVDVIVSSAFFMTVTLLGCVSAQLLRESLTIECGWLLEAMVWCFCLGLYLLRFMSLGSNISRKYRGCLSAIITEQINLHLAIEQRPESKDKLTVANNVLKLAADLLKELDAPFKIYGIANHYLYTIIKVVILSALSGILSEMLGFKLKLDKIKIK